ncbi:MAG: FAA hydrolase family protein, partial [Actinobacteria bacterium]|nr:FAA hydrolase family protein [Actinomycetota bacterium]
MKIARLGQLNQERPAIILDSEKAVFVDHIIKDWNRTELENGALEKISKLNLTALDKVALKDFRLGSPIARPTKVICVGLNYARHAA